MNKKGAQGEWKSKRISVKSPHWIDKVSKVVCGDLLEGLENLFLRDWKVNWIFYFSLENSDDLGFDKNLKCYERFVEQFWRIFSGNIP